MLSGVKGTNSTYIVVPFFFFFFEIILEFERCFNDFESKRFSNMTTKASSRWQEGSLKIRICLPIFIHFKASLTT